MRYQTFTGRKGKFVGERRKRTAIAVGHVQLLSVLLAWCSVILCNLKALCPQGRPFPNSVRTGREVFLTV